MSNHFIATCPVCGKRGYATRSQARSAAKQRDPGDPMNAYRCPGHGALWHYGHLAARVKDGRVPRISLGLSAPRSLYSDRPRHFRHRASDAEYRLELLRDIRRRQVAGEDIHVSDLPVSIRKIGSIKVSAA